MLKGIRYLADIRIVLLATVLSDGCIEVNTTILIFFLIIIIVSYCADLRRCRLSLLVSHSRSEPPGGAVGTPGLRFLSPMSRFLLAIRFFSSNLYLAENIG
jgi:hypothetical protein